MIQEKKENLIKFIRDERMSRTIKEFLKDCFLEESNAKDVNLLAAERIAINLLAEAWKKLETYKNEETDEYSTSYKQIGL
jgi:hypothetical protein